jgi:peptide/nickel transport system substrate-binding protein
MRHRTFSILAGALLVLAVSVSAMANPSGRLVVSLAETPPHLDSMIDTRVHINVVAQHIYEQLFANDVGFRPQPMLVDTWEFADEGRTWTFTLRQGVLFHNGDEVKVDDVEASFHRWTQISNIGRAYADASFEKVDDYTFRITSATPRATLLENLADVSQALLVLPKAIAEAAGTNPLTEDQWIGSGPFAFERLVPDESIVLRAFPDYVGRDEEPSGYGGGKVALVEVLEFRIIKDVPTRTAALRSGEVDIIPDGIPGTDKPTLEADPDVTVQVVPAVIKWGPMFNGASPVTGNHLVRQAIAAAMDHEELALAMVGGDPDLFDINPGIVFRNSFYYSDVGAATWNQNDLERASALLAEAGYAGEEVVIISTKASLVQDRFATVMQAQLQDIGMNVRVDWYDGATLREARTQPDLWDIIAFGWATNFNPGIYAQAYHCNSGSWTGLCEPGLDEYFDRAAAIIDLDERRAVYTEMQAAMHEEYVPYVYIGDFHALRAYRTGLTGVRPFKEFLAWGVATQ